MLVVVDTLQEPLKNYLIGAVEGMKTLFKNDVKNELSTEIEQNVVAKVNEMKPIVKSELKEELEEDIEQKMAANVNEAKEDLETKLGVEITKRFEDQAPDLETIMTASTTVMNNILIPQMEQKVTTKVNEVKDVVKSDLKTELDQSLSSGLTGLTQKITNEVDQKTQELTEQITSRIRETQEKVIFAVVRKSDVGNGQAITFDTEIANIGNSMDASSGVFTVKKKGLYAFTFTAVSTSGGHLQIEVLKNGNRIFTIEDFTEKSEENVAASWMSQLEERDTISLRLSVNGIHGCSDDWIHFTGQLLHAE